MAVDRGISIKPDYNKTAPEIYREFTLQYLIPPGKTKYPADARILYDAGLYRRSTESLNRFAQLADTNTDYLPS
jgi:hypothetical protein